MRWEAMDRDVLTLPSMFSPDELLVRRVVQELSESGRGPTLAKTRELTCAQVSQALDVAFWSSLESNEGRPTRARLLFAEPELLHGPIRFEVPAAYTPRDVSLLAPAIPEGGCIGVSATGSAMCVWGMHHTDPGSSLHALELWLPLPGVVHVRIGALRPFAVVSDGKASVLADAALALPDELRLRLGKSLVGDDIRKAQLAWRECLLLAALARRVLHRGSGGGTLLIVPETDGPWNEGLDLARRFAEPDTSLRDAVRHGLLPEPSDSGRSSRVSAPGIPEALRWQVVGPGSRHLSEETGALRRVAPYANVDGAVVITRDLAVLGFGAKILVPAPTTQVLIAGPQAPVSRVDLRPIDETGGTRHQSAARFVGAYHEGVAIVVSHDAHISLFFWDEPLAAVRMIRNVDWWD